MNKQNCTRIDQIVKAVRLSGRDLPLVELADIIGISKDAVRKAAVKGVKAGVLVRTEPGVFGLAGEHVPAPKKKPKAKASSKSKPYDIDWRDVTKPGTDYFKYIPYDKVSGLDLAYVWYSDFDGLKLRSKWTGCTGQYWPNISRSKATEIIEKHVKAIYDRDGNIDDATYEKEKRRSFTSCCHCDTGIHQDEFYGDTGHGYACKSCWNAYHNCG